ncbi:S8 family serine peptidase [Agreia pratensis]|uniref:S8 family serine peptidase n=1 Tax=Agreia pratensis TaxID=150121 RepID=UPI00188D4914|nr:S8 family serine peptidase [Agreia pratensis]MBF4636286.1 S8 family serine peptidase [Agreia pratensis]
MPNQPVQLVLNAGRLRIPRERSHPADNGKDFFEGNDEGFVTHRDGLVAALAAIRGALANDAEFGGLGHVKVSMNRDAIAKSHRPQNQIFRDRWTPQVGTDGLGEPIFAVTPESLDKVIAAAAQAETIVPTKTNGTTGEVTPNPSRKRCEISGIASITLWTEQDRRDFSAAEAASWLSRAGTGGRYIVSCFSPQTTADIPQLAVRTASAVAALQNVSNIASIVVEPLQGNRAAGMILTVRVAENHPSLEPVRGGGDAVPSTALIDVHREILDGIARNPIIRLISLPPVVSHEEAATSGMGSEAPSEVFDVGDETLSKVGVIDGGVAVSMANWVAERWGNIAPDDQDTAHGTFISGLLVAERALNPHLNSSQTHGCFIFDVDVLPADPGRTGIPFDDYYPGGVPQFLDEIETAVEAYRRDHDVRVFNFSMNFQSPGNSARYGYTAQRLDEIAKKNDIIFVISAGNLEPAGFRQEWHSTPSVALAQLAADTQSILAEPGESLHNVSVGALNPPTMSGQVPFALARYSRRGPGLRGATKPDFAHVGGSGTPDKIGNQGLLSVDADGFLVSGGGTSYAAPLVARRLADLNALIEGEVSREVLIALMVHFAHTPSLYTHKDLRGVARDLIGFGVPSTAEMMLQRDDSEITLVVSSLIRPKEDNSFRFSWPEALVAEGRCRGQARVTLVASPPIAYEHGEERIRANIHAHLQQRTGEDSFTGRLNPINALPKTAIVHQNERDLLKESMKWQMVKSFETPKMTGSGPTSDWRFTVDYLERTDESLPVDGIEYAAVVTIADPTKQAPVFSQMRQHLSTIGIQTDDIRTSIRARTTT